MQQKNLKYLLLIGVAIIWGMVLYRVLSGFNNTDTFKATSQKMIPSSKDSSNFEPYSLLLDYYDPFGVEIEKTNFKTSTETTTIKDNVSSENKPASKPAIDISFIKYKGIITNSITQKKAAIISIRGKDELARIDKIIDNIKILAIKKDKIQVKYLDKKFWIKRQ